MRVHIDNDVPRLVAAAVAVLGFVPWLVFVSMFPRAYDAFAYYDATGGNLYSSTIGHDGAYLYSPAFAQAIEPLRSLGWNGFRSAWRVLEVAAMAVMAGPLTGPLIALPPFRLEIGVANIHLLLALAIVAGLRWPCTWAFVLLTKITPGVGLLWFAVRHEWRNLAIAMGTTAVIVIASVVISPGDWLAWPGSLLRDVQAPGDAGVAISVPLVVRVPIAALLVTWGARTDRRWTVLVAAFIALPEIYVYGLTMLVGLLWPVTLRLFVHAATRSALWPRSIVPEPSSAT